MARTKWSVLAESVVISTHLALVGIAPGQTADELERMRRRPAGTSNVSTPPSNVGPVAAKLDLPKVIEYLQSHGHDKSGGECAKFTREAIESGAGGATIKRPSPDNGVVRAKDYGPSLVKFGFHEYSSREIDAKDAKKGDVVIFQADKRHPSGHMAMYDGYQWISDFKQKNFWIGANPNAPPAYKIYRYEQGATTIGPNGGAAKSSPGLGGVLINPSPQLDRSNIDDREAAKVLRQRPSTKSPSWSIDLPH